MSKQRTTRWVSIAVLLVSCSVFFTPPYLARLTLPPYMVDMRELAEKAPLVFRGHVLLVLPTVSGADPSTVSTATIAVDRWYRGTGPAEETLQFTYNKFVADEHNCINFPPDTYWVIFAREISGKLQLIDDCTGAMTVSPRFGPNLKAADWLAQMEADFLAGLRDPDPEARLASIQRLGGLKLPSSRAALHAVIEKVKSLNQSGPFTQRCALEIFPCYPECSDCLPRATTKIPNGPSLCNWNPLPMPVQCPI